MRRRIGRCFWLLAWGVWVWCGFGLYRELPKDLGPRVRSLPLPRDPHQLLGFIGGSDDFAVISRTMSPLHTRIDVWNAESGVHLRKIYGPEMTKCFLPARRTDDGLLLLANNVPNPDRPGHLPGVFLLDVGTEDWRKLGDREARSASIHPFRNSLCVVFADGPNSSRGRASVIEWPSLKEIASSKLPGPEISIGRPAVIDEEIAVLSGDNIGAAVIPETPARSAPRVRAKTKPGKPGLPIIDDDRPKTPILVKAQLQRTRLSESGVETSMLDLADLKRSSFATPDGTVVFDGRESPPWLARFDLSDRGVPFVCKTTQSKDGNEGGDLGMARVVATNAEMVFCDDGSLWNVDSRSRDWKARDHESPQPANGEDSFLVIEHWDKIWNEWFPNLKFVTRSLRRMKDGSLIVRTASGVLPPLRRWNAAHTFAVSDNGTVYRIPFRVNLTLFAICQSILALPLIFLWMILRWRRKRRLRLSSMTP